MKSTPPPLEGAQRSFYDRMLGKSSPLNFIENEARMSIYADGYVARLTGTLSDTYAMTERILGKERFFIVAKKYVSSNPSKVYNINRYGESFSRHLSQEIDSKKRPWLAALADLEWRIAWSFHAMDQAPWSPEDFASLSERQIETLVFRFQPSMQLFSSDWPLRDIFEAYQTRASKKDFPKSSGDYLMYRKDHVVQFTKIDSNEASLMRAMIEGNPLGVALEKAGVEDPALVFRCFQTWPQLNLLASIKGL